MIAATQTTRIHIELIDPITRAPLWPARSRTNNRDRTKQSLPKPTSPRGIAGQLSFKHLFLQGITELISRQYKGKTVNLT